MAVDLKKLANYFDFSKGYTAFGGKIPRKLRSFQVCPEIVASGAIQNGQEIGAGLKVFWGNKRANVQLQRDGDWIQIETSGSFGDYVSLSWSCDIELIERISSSSFVTMGFDEIIVDSVGGTPYSMVAFINAERGSRKMRESQVIQNYDGRKTASFLLNENYELWSVAQANWFDVVFSGEKMKRISVLNPRIWAQDKVKV